MRRRGDNGERGVGGGTRDNMGKGKEKCEVKNMDGSRALKSLNRSGEDKWPVVSGRPPTAPGGRLCESSGGL